VEAVREVEEKRQKDDSDYGEQDHVHCGLLSHDLQARTC
jgi:hypothetical protein